MIDCRNEANLAEGNLSFGENLNGLPSLPTLDEVRLYLSRLSNVECFHAVCVRKTIDKCVWPIRPGMIQTIKLLGIFHFNLDWSVHIDDLEVRESGYLRSVVQSD